MTYAVTGIPARARTRASIESELPLTNLAELVMRGELPEPVAARVQSIADSKNPELMSPIFDALVFAVVCCGFTARSALETLTVSEPRMKRIADAMHASKYSIHDLCRCKGGGDEKSAA